MCLAVLLARRVRAVLGGRSTWLAWRRRLGWVYVGGARVFLLPARLARPAPLFSRQSRYIRLAWHFAGSPPRSQSLCGRHVPKFPCAAFRFSAFFVFVVSLSPLSAVWRLVCAADAAPWCCGLIKIQSRRSCRRSGCAAFAACAACAVWAAGLRSQHSVEGWLAWCRRGFAG